MAGVVRKKLGLTLERFADVAAIDAEIERVRSLSGNALRRLWHLPQL